MILQSFATQEDHVSESDEGQNVNSNIDCEKSGILPSQNLPLNEKNKDSNELNRSGLKPEWNSELIPNKNDKPVTQVCSSEMVEEIDAFLKSFPGLSEEYYLLDKIGEGRK